MSLFGSLPKKEMILMYKKMLQIRYFEEKAGELYSLGVLPGAIHSYVGQEAVAVGVCANLRRDDYLTSTHRGHGHCIAKGMRLDKMMAELFGKETGYCRGKGGSMRFFDQSTGMLGANGIVGAGIPIATGVGLSIKLRGTDQVVACFFGDGAANQGSTHEGINLAAVWRLPVVFVCENNLYAITTHQSASMAIKDVADRAKGYGILGMVVDGMDILAVYKAAKKIVQRVRAGEGPTLLECKTYRFRGHSRGDPAHGHYRTMEEVEAWIEKDPIKRFRAVLLEKGVLTEKEVDQIEQENIGSVEEAVRFAEESPYPRPEAALEDIFV